MAYFLKVPATSDLKLDTEDVLHTTTSNTFEYEIDIAIPVGTTRVWLWSRFAGAGSQAGGFWLYPDRVEFWKSTGAGSAVRLNSALPFDGQRHVYRVVARAANDYELIVDGSPVATSTENRTGAGIILGYFGKSTNSEDFDLYRLIFKDSEGGTTLFDWNPENISSGNTLFDSQSGNDLVQEPSNWPSDDSEWVFYNDGGGGVDTLIPTLIPSGEVVGTPSVTNLLKLIEPNIIPTEELVNTPTVDAGAILISPATIPTGEVVYNVSVVDLTQFIEAEDIPTQGVVGSPSLELLLSRIFPTAIATQENFETPLIIGGDRIAIPINDRVTWNRVAAYLRTRKFSGSDNDVILAWLRSEGYIDTFNDAFNTYLEDVEALQGSLTDKYSNWRRQ